MRKLVALLVLAVLLIPLAAVADEEGGVEKHAEFGWITRAEGLTNTTDQYVVDIYNQTKGLSAIGSVGYTHIAKLNTSVEVKLNLDVTADSYYSSENGSIVLKLNVVFGGAEVTWNLAGTLHDALTYNVTFADSMGRERVVGAIEISSDFNTSYTFTIPNVVGVYEEHGAESEELSNATISGELRFYRVEPVTNESLEEDVAAFYEQFPIVVEYEVSVLVNTTLVAEINVTKGGEVVDHIVEEIDEGANELLIPVNESGDYNVSVNVRYVIQQFVVKLEDISFEVDADEHEVMETIQSQCENVSELEDFMEELLDTLTDAMEKGVMPEFEVKEHEAFEHEEEGEETEAPSLRTLQTANALASESPYEEYTVLVAMTVSAVSGGEGGTGGGGEGAPAPSAELIIPLVGLLVATIAIAYAVGRKNSK